MANRYALLIGTSEYQDERLARLKTPAADLNVLASLLGDENIGGYQVKVLHNQPFTTVLKEIVSFLKDRHRDDHLLLYFSGHGVLDEGGNLYLATKDTERDLLSATALSNRFIKDEMDRSRSKRQVLILDCCHSGAFLKGTKGESPALTQATFEGYGRAVLTAADSIQYALEGDQVDEGLELSLFTHFLVEGIRTGEADRSNDGWIELDEWFDYAFRKVRDHTDRQTPRKFVDNQYGELYIARNPKANEVKPAELPEKLRARMKSEYKPDRLEAIQELGGFLEGDDPSLAMAAQNALEKISVDDDSLSIRNSASGYLAGHAEHQAVKKAEEERRAQQQAEAERLAALKAEEERRAREKAEAQRLKVLEAEGKRLARERAEAERRGALRAKEERERAEADRLAQQRAEQERLAQEKAKAEHLAAQPAGAGLMASEVAGIEQSAHEERGAQAPGDTKRLDALPRWTIWAGLVLVGGLIVGLIISRQANPVAVVSSTATPEAAVTVAPTIVLAANIPPTQPVSTSPGVATPTDTSPAQPATTSPGIVLGTNTPPPAVSTVAPTEAAGRIAFISDRDGNNEIYVMNADGSGLTRLTNLSYHVESPAWSPDGMRIAFVSMHRYNHREIYVINADGSGLTQLTRNYAVYGGGDYPAWSPDGTHIAFINYLGGLGGFDDIYVMNADGSYQTQLTYNEYYMEPDWSPDGTRISFVSNRKGDYGIQVMNADGSERTRLTNGADYNPAWSPDGTRIAFASNRDGNYEIYVTKPDGSDQIRLTNNSVGDWDPAWSSDGKRIAFVSDRDGNREIYVMNADGSGQIRLTDNSADDSYPAWQP
jgi:hypothetical protein